MNKSSQKVEDKAEPKIYAVKEEKLNKVLAELQKMKLTAKEHQFIVSAFQLLIQEE
jgi:hypothetical protein